MPKPVEKRPDPLIAVLISGRGSNLQSLIEATRDGRLDATIALVISNRADAQGLERAKAANIPTLVMPHVAHASREHYDRALVEVLVENRIGLICLAGFMRLLGPTFCDLFPHRILNIHPSLLPSFPGQDAQRQAFRHGVRVSGVTVHFVTAELDAGPIIAQASVPVHDDDTEEMLSARILAAEHRLYPEAVARILAGGWRIDGRRVVFPPRP